jgi:hypothetical protein
MPRTVSLARRSKLALAALALAALALAACAGRPFPTAPAKTVQRAIDRQYGPAAAGRPGVIALCYSRVANSQEEVLEEARYHCGGAEPVPQDQDMVWTPCPLLQPVRASFICKPAPSAPEVEPAGQAN